MSPFAWQSNKAVLFYLKKYYGKSIQILANWAVIKGEAYLGLFVCFKKNCLLLFSCQALSNSMNPRTAPCQASLPFPISRSLLKLLSTESVILPRPLFPNHKTCLFSFWREKFSSTWNLSSLFNRDVILWLPGDKSILSLTLVGVAMSL